MPFYKNPNRNFQQGTQREIINLKEKFDGVFGWYLFSVAIMESTGKKLAIDNC